MQEKAVSFEKSNVSDLRKKLSELLSDKEKVEEYKSSSREYICGKYNWDSVAKQTMEV